MRTYYIKLDTCKDNNMVINCDECGGKFPNHLFSSNIWLGRLVGSLQFGTIQVPDAVHARTAKAMHQH